MAEEVVTPPVVEPVIPPVIPPAGDPWYKGADPELVGHLQTKGWADKTPAEVALAAAQAHREAEKRLGIPADQIVRWPKDRADEEGWKAIRARLGVPADPVTGYDFSSVKYKDGTELSPEFAGFLKKTAADLYLNPEQALTMAQRQVENQDGQTATKASERAAYLTEQRQLLEKDWGKNVEANTAVANAGAAKLGVTPEDVSKLIETLGHYRTLTMFQKIGVMSGEDRFFTPPGGGDRPGIMTREQALAQRETYKADPAWVQKYNAGDAEARRQMMALNQLISGEVA